MASRISLTPCRWRRHTRRLIRQCIGSHRYPRYTRLLRDPRSDNISADSGKNCHQYSDSCSAMIVTPFCRCCRCSCTMRQQSRLIAKKKGHCQVFSTGLGEQFWIEAIYSVGEGKLSGSGNSPKVSWIVICSPSRLTVKVPLVPGSHSAAILGRSMEC